MKSLRENLMMKLLMLACSFPLLGAVSGAAAPLTVSPVPDVTMPEDGITNMVFLVSGGDTNASPSFSRLSADTVLFPLNSVTFETVGTNDTIRLAPATDLDGSEAVQFTVTSGPETVTNTFNVLVQAVNDPPQISIAAVTMNEDQISTNAVTVSDVDTAGNLLTLSWVSGTTALLPAGAVTFGGSNNNSEVIIQPADNAFGTQTVSVAVSDGILQATNTFQLIVNPVNDAPEISPVIVSDFNEDTVSTNGVTVSDIDDNNSVLTLQVVSAATDLFPAGSITFGGSNSNSSIVFSPAANRFGTGTVSVAVFDDESASATNTFDVVVLPVEDEPVLSGITGFYKVNTNATFNPFSGAGITDDDEIGGVVEQYDLTVSVTDGAEFGEMSGVPFSGTLSQVVSNLQNIAYDPTEGILPSGVTNEVMFSVEIKDYDNQTMALAFTVAVAETGRVFAVNTAPQVQFSLTQSLIDDNISDKIFVAAISDPEGANVSIALSTPGDIGNDLGNFSPATASFTGSSFFAEDYIRNVRYVPEPDVVTLNSNITVRLTVADESGSTSTNDVSLTIREVNDPPLISGTTANAVYTGDSTPVIAFPSAIIQDPDRQGTQSVQFKVVSGDPALGTFAQSDWSANMSPAAATAMLRTNYFNPIPNSVPIGQTVPVTLTLHVRDSYGLERTDSLTTVAINGVNGAPVFMEIPEVQPRLVPPSDSRPFDGIWVSDDDDVNNDLIITITMDDPDKGWLTVTNTVSGFSNTVAGTYTYAGNVAEVSNLFSLIYFDVNEAHQFPVNAPGGTEFTLTAEDAQGNQSTRYLDTVQLELPRTILVTQAEDNSDPGSLRYAVAAAAPNDTVAFALDSYPAVITIHPTNGVIDLSKHITIKGPGADQLRISGDTDSNGSPDVQLFTVAANVRLEGITFDGGTALTGGAIYVGPDGDLTLRSCVFRNNRAVQWGGAIDVDGGRLSTEQCLFDSNWTDEALGLGGGAVSLFTTRYCSFDNTTFAANRQASMTGYGGGAVYAESSNPQVFLDADFIHCTFAENVDEAGAASSIYSFGSGTTMWTMNSIYADGRGRNLEVDATGVIFSWGANISDDSTFTVMSIGGVPDSVFLLDDETDQILTDAMLGPLTYGVGPSAVYPLQGGSPAIDAAWETMNGTDQQGLFRDLDPDIGASEFGAGKRIVVNEVLALNGTNDFVEFYVPRDAVVLDLGGYALSVYDSPYDYAVSDGSNVLRHVFATNTTVIPGSGIIVADSLMPAISNVTVTLPGEAAPLGLQERSVLVLRDPDGRIVLEAAYNRDIADPDSIAQLLVYDPGESLTLSPQFSGFAYLPHTLLSADESSPGADTVPQLFGAENASPVAVPDDIIVGEDELKRIMVLDNDSDADGSDMIVLTGLPVVSSAVSPQNIPYSVATNEVSGYGDSVWYDPRAVTNVQQMAAGAELYDGFSYRIADYGAADIQSIEAYNTSNVLVTSGNHRLSTNDSVRILDTGEYDGTYQVIADLGDNSFAVDAVYTTNFFGGRWIAQSGRGEASDADVFLTIIGANDLPVAGTDAAAAGEEEVLQLMADLNILPNDDDIDTDDNAATLRLVGVLDTVYPIQAFGGAVGDSVVSVVSTNHGLSSGTGIVISGYGGHPSYNGSKTVTVLDAHTFTIPAAYVDSDAVAGVWGLLDDANRYEAVSALEADVLLDLRADRSQTSITYDPLGSSLLDALSQGEMTVDSFYYAVEDSHGAVSLGLIEITVIGTNDLPVSRPDPDSLSGLSPFVGSGETLADVVSGLTIVNSAGLSDGTGRTDALVLPEGASSSDAVLITDILVTSEDADLLVYVEDILGNDSDVDTSNVLAVVSVSSSALDVEVTQSGTTSIVYAASSSTNLAKLAHNEMQLDTFAVVVSDNDSGMTTNFVGVLVVGVNDTPSAIDDFAGTPEDVQIAFNAIEYPSTNPAAWDREIDINGSVPDDQLWIVDDGGMSSNGAAYSISNSVFTYDPAVSAWLDGLSDVTAVTDVIEYTVTDQTFIFANDDRFSVSAAGSAFDLDVLANDRIYNIRGGTLRIAELGLPDQNGSVVTNAEGTEVIYTPAVNFVGDEVFTYAVSDEWGNISRGRVVVSVVIEALNGDLQANADFYTVARGESLILPVLGNDNRLPADSSGFVITGLSGTNGTDAITLEGGDLVFRQLNDTGPYPYTVRFAYEVSGGGTARAEAQVEVLVVNRQLTLPVQDDYFQVAVSSLENELDVVFNDVILPGTGILDIDEITLDVQHGTVTIDEGANRLLYTPDQGFVGSDSLNYKVVDNLGGTGIGTVFISVGAPMAANDVFSVYTNSGHSVQLDVLANDRELPGMPQSLRITSVTPAGSLIEISPNEDYLLFSDTNGVTGVTNFVYTARDDLGDGTREVTGMVTVYMEGDGVYANADVFMVAQDGSSIWLPVLDNDRSLPERGRALTVTGLGTGPDAPNAGGTVVLSPDNTALVYTPASGFSGEETFTYMMSDSYGSDSARVTVKVQASVLAAADDLFAVYNSGASTPEFTLDVLLNDRLLPAAGGLLQIESVGIDTLNNTNSPSAQGMVTVAPDGQTLLYTPNTNMTGSSYAEHFTYEVSDGSDRRAFANVQIEVLFRVLDEDLTDETNDDRYSVRRNSLGNVLNVLENDGARPGDASTWTITSLSAPEFGGQVQVLGDAVLYSPLPGFLGTDRFSYSIADGLGGTAEAEVRVRVGDITLNPDRYTVISGTVSNAMDVLVNDRILPEQADDYELVLDSAGALSASGTVSMSSNLVYYTPGGVSNTYPYMETFEYVVLDDSALAVTQTVSVLVIEEGSDRDTAQISILVQGVNDIPVITNSTSSVQTGDKTPVTPFPQMSVTDVDEWGQELLTAQVEVFEYPVKGSLTSLGAFTDEGGGLYTMAGTPGEVTTALQGLVYVPTENWIDIGTNELVSLLVSIRDPFIAVPVTNQVDILVTPVNDPPVISGTVAGQTVYHALTLRPMSGVTITEVDNLTLQLLDVQVALDDASHGSLQTLGIFSEIGAGIYSVSGVTAEAATSALRAMVFDPTTDGRLSPTNLTESTRFTITVDDRVAAPVVDDTTTVDATYALVQTRVSPFGGAENAEGFGASVGTGRDWIAVGAPWSNADGISGGAVTVYGRNAGGPGQWDEVLNLLSPDATGDDEFGYSVAMSGEYLFVGAPGHNNTGAAYLFEWNMGGTNTWDLVKKITGSDTGNGDRFGTSVAMDDGRIAVGAVNADYTGANSGAVYLFARDAGETNQWEQTQQIGPSDSAATAGFGHVVRLDGSRLAVSAPQYSEIRPNGGAVYALEHSGAVTGQWEHVQLLFGDVEGENDEFGYAMDLDEDVIVVGAPIDSNGNSGYGAAYVFVHTGATNGPWMQSRRIERPVNTSGEMFGASVSVDQDLVVIGAPGVGNQQGSDVGEARVYYRHEGGTNQWGFIDLLLPPDDGLDGYFGYAMDLNGFTLGVTSFGNPGRAVYPGTLNVFRLKFDNAPSVLNPIEDQYAVVTEWFEFAVPADAFADPDWAEMLGLTAVQADGSPLAVTGISFDANTGLFSGMPVATGRVDVLLIASDSDDQSATNAFGIIVLPLSPYGTLAAKTQWKQDVFGDQVLGDPIGDGMDWHDEADADGDGLTVHEEYVFGTDPEIANDPSDHDLVIVEYNAAGDYLTVSYTRRADDPDLSYVILKSADLLSWVETDFEILSESAVPLGDGVERAYVDLDVAGDAACFYRVQGTE
jgi:VCBS repeat-containing protein